MVKLLVCLPFATPSIGGGAFVLLNLLEPLAELGCDPAVVAFQPELQRLVPSRFRTYLLPKKVGSVAYYAQYPVIAARLAEIFRREAPEVVLCNSYQPFWLALAARRWAGSRARIVAGEQNNLNEMFRGARFGRLRAALTRWLDPKADRVVVPAEALAAHLAADYAVPLTKIETIPNPVPLEKIRRLAEEPVDYPGFGSGEPVFLGVGTLDEQKDFRTLLRAFQRLRRLRKARLVVLGNGPLRDDLRAEAAALGVAEATAFLGFQENPFKFMKRAAAFVLSSRYEGFGLVLVEAMACGCPVVSTDCPFGPREILAAEDGEPAGLLSGVGDAEGLSRQMLALLDSPQTRQTFVERGLRRAQRYSSSAVAARYAAVLKGAAGRAGVS